MSLRVATLEEVLHYGARLPKGLLPPIAGGAGPTLDQQLGVAASDSVASKSLTVTHSVPLAELLVAFGFGGNSVALTLASSPANTFSTAIANAPVNPYGIIAATIVTTGLTSGSSTVTATRSSGTNTIGVAAASFTGVTSATAYGAASANWASTTPSVATAVSVTAGDLVVGFLGQNDQTSSTVTLPTGWASLVASAARPTIYGGYFVPISAGVVTFNPTTTASPANGWIGVAVFSGAGAARSIRMLV